METPNKLMYDDIDRKKNKTAEEVLSTIREHGIE